MTFLTFVCTHLMGPPVAGTCWRCPYCESSGAAFSVRPPKGALPVKFKCHKCQEWGDEVDLLSFFRPKAPRVDVYKELADLRNEFNRIVKRDRGCPHKSKAPPKPGRKTVGDSKVEGSPERASKLFRPGNGASPSKRNNRRTR